ncbi:hypothetical protein B296_00047113 [Ensete ventricosum]|uniref:Uncharacterized protein n=1 Tax=Ensete ventricosum TaxID=4639 RepID=A0A426Y9V3_ENSVE|nr:hypothetical protein B296_00047113 [Ensete ventricosum]
MQKIPNLKTLRFRCPLHICAPFAVVRRPSPVPAALLPIFPMSMTLPFSYPSSVVNPLWVAPSLSPFVALLALVLFSKCVQLTPLLVVFVLWAVKQEGYLSAPRPPSFIELP